ncbi:exo-alpha-sialidase [soil metagenome]
MSAHPQRRTTLVLVVVTALVVAVVGLSMLRTRGDGSSPEARQVGSHEMMEALEKHPGLAAHRLPLAFVAEKLEQQGGEASGEIVNGPAQEAYDQRAFPRTTIADAQQKNAKAAFARAKTRAKSADGRQTLARAQVAGAGWTPLGPNGGPVDPLATYTGTPTNVSGRTTALAFGGSTCTPAACTLFAGTAGGGLWRTDNALATQPAWRSVGADIPSTAIGSVYRAPDGDLYVGTGEPNGSSDSEAGLGLFRSTNGGTTFSKVTTTTADGTDFTKDRSIAAVAVDPNAPRHVLIGTAVARHGSSSVNGGRFTPPGAAKVGLYESTEGGTSWSLALSQASDTVDPGSPTGADYFRGGISKITFDPTHSGVAYASMFDYGLFRATTARGAWKQIYTIKTPGDPATGLDSRVEFALATLSGGATRIYLGDATYYDNSVAGLLRSDDGTASSPSFQVLSDPAPGSVGYGSYNFCQGQCSYDMAVTTSVGGNPDEVFLSGSMNYDELTAFGGPGNSNGRAVVRSATTGVSFTDMTNDDQPKRNGLHPDHHALVIVPATAGQPETFFTASDGGVVQQHGPYVDQTGECATRKLSGANLADCQRFLKEVPTLNQEVNKGLQTLQYQSVSVTPSGIVQGGTQDNGTWESDYSGGFGETVGGDGGQSGFNAGTSAIRYHSYYAPQHDVSFRKGDPDSWDYISDPLIASGEAASFYTPFTADPNPKRAGTVFDGLPHVWRTTDNGGDQKFLDQYCNEITGDYGHRPQPCGDWVKLGGGGSGDLSGKDPSNYVVAVERAPQDTGTLWAGTRLGNIFVSANADATNPASVKFRQYDKLLGLPRRFPSGIFIDPKDANHAFVSYSGYSAYSPGGHVYEVRVNPQTGKGSAKDLSADLGDQPVTDIVYVPSSQSLFASTDFGVLTKPVAGGSWTATAGLPPVAVYGLTLDQTSGTLYAATHGRSVWQLQTN